MSYFPFDSRNPLYRSKTGAITQDEKLTLRVLLHKDALCSKAFLRIFDDQNGNTTEIELSPKEWLEDYRFWDCEVSLEKGIYFYCFRYESAHGEFYITKCDHSKGHVSSNGAYWQQTVYDKEFSTPDWLKGGLIYQIFPDRFYKAKTNIQNEFEDRYIVDDWNKIPEHRQNNGPCSLGNDYYGGNLQGITEKLPYLAEIGVSCIYLNPIFEAHSNHRYNTADYLKVDSLLGSEKDLKKLCKTAEKHNIKIILDGVFSHTGADSIYFNMYNRYNQNGAYNSKESHFYNWFNFKNWPDSYDAWWGVPSLPETNEHNPDFIKYITGENGVLRYWSDCGIFGWRLDVADELPDEFIEKIRTAIKTKNKDAYLLGEVWEDASNKISYSKRRRFLLGDELDSVMNYPFANSIIDFIKSGDSVRFADTIYQIIENYPAPALNVLMNHIGTHDTPRILTRLADNFSDNSSRDWQVHQTLSPEQYQNAVKRLKCAVAIQYFLPGIPSLYYGDEVGLTGYGDPFCRAVYPWDNPDNDLLNYYKLLGNLRQNLSCVKQGEFITIHCNPNLLVFMRKDKKDAVLVAVNVGTESLWFDLPNEFKNNPEIIIGNSPNCDNYTCIDGNSITIYKTTF